MTVQVKTNVRIKARPENTGYIYGSLKDRADAGMRDVQIYFPLPETTAKSVYALDEVEEIASS